MAIYYLRATEHTVMDETIVNTPQPEKKTWVTPDIEVISVLGGPYRRLNEDITLLPGTLS